MISDVLSDAVREIDEILSLDRVCYQGSRRARIIQVRNAMDAMRDELDSDGATVLRCPLRAVHGCEEEPASND